MTSIYCYGELEPNDDEDECHIDRVVVDERWRWWVSWVC
jgi:hypothetical protein